jgi:hypothetical protein
LYFNFPHFVLSTLPIELALVLSSPWFGYDSVTHLCFGLYHYSALLHRFPIFLAFYVFSQC